MQCVAFKHSQNQQVIVSQHSIDHLDFVMETQYVSVKEEYYTLIYSRV